LAKDGFGDTGRQSNKTRSALVTLDLDSSTSNSIDDGGSSINGGGRISGSVGATG
jgi:hypothetical protein